MRIITFSYWDKTRNWSFEKLEFQKLTLLVGASGVGKTQILNALTNIYSIVKGDSFNGIKWCITFDINEKHYIWEGEFETAADELVQLEVEHKEQNGYNIIYEKLSLADETIIDRTADRLLFNNKETVKLSSQQSAINLLRNEQLIFPIYYTGFLLIREVNGIISSLNNTYYLPKKSAEEFLGTYRTIDAIRSTYFSIQIKAYITFENDAMSFNNIKDRYISIFPQVEDIRIGYFSQGNETLCFQIKEKGVDEWIGGNNISSGMHRSLMQICELYLCPNGSVILMDEFENSLGINCIDELTNDILNTKRDIQFILTSHHPYIINNIPYKNWKIVTRNAGKVFIKDASEYRIGESKHDAFLQLIQVEEYSDGVN